MAQPAMLGSGAVLLGTTTGTGAGDALLNYAVQSTYQVTGRTWSGSGAATVKIQVSNDLLAWIDAASIDLVLSDSAYASDGFVMQAPWRHIRANVTAISGTGAWVTVTMGA